MKSKEMRHYSTLASAAPSLESSVGMPWESDAAPEARHAVAKQQQQREPFPGQLQTLTAELETIWRRCTVGLSRASKGTKLFAELPGQLQTLTAELETIRR